MDGIDDFPLDPSEWIDSDMDGVGDNGDAFPNDPDRQVKEEQSTMLIFVALFTVVIVVGLILLLVGWKRGGDDDLSYLSDSETKNSDNNTNETMVYSTCLLYTSDAADDV